MIGKINGVDFGELNAMKYYAPPAGWTAERKKDNVRSKIFSGDWYAGEKKDGFFGKFVKDDAGNMILYSRSRNVNGVYVNKITWVPQLQSFFDELPNGTCLLGELYLPSQPGSKCVQTILGCLEAKAIERQSKGEKIHFYIFDCLAYAGRSYLNSGYLDRINMVRTISTSNPYVDTAKYYNGEELWERLQEILADGREGMVLIHKNAIYEPDKRPSKTTLKVKQELKETLDVIVMGANKPTRLYGGKELDSWQYWENTVTNEHVRGDYFMRYCAGEPYEPVTKAYFNNWAGSLIIGAYKDGEQVQIGSISGLTEEILMNWRDYVGKVMEITAMQIMDTQGLRHPKFIQWRPDLSKEDADWYKIFGAN